MLAQERERTPPSKRRARRVVALPMVAIEAVIGGIDVDLDVRVSCGDLFHPGDGDMLVLLAEMQQSRGARLQVLKSLSPMIPPP